MKQPNPLLPQGSFEAHARGKSHVRIAVFTILAIHVVVLGALLIQGCKREDERLDDPALLTETNDTSGIAPFNSSNTDVVTPAGDTGAAPAFTAPPLPGASPATSAPVAPPLPAQYATTSAPAPVAPPVVPPVPPVTPAGDSMVTEPNAAPSTTEHTIVRGDTFSGLATRYGVTVRAIQNANPDVNPARLKLGQKVKIPARTANGSTRVGSVSNGTASPDTYTVKSGDTLGRIATTHGTTVRAIQKLNNLTTTQIRVGQKLKLPAKAQAPATATPNPASPGGFTPPPPPVPAPAQ